MATRINKYLSEVGYCSRRVADRLIEEGKVTINGKIPKMGDKVEEGDQVEVEGQKIEKSSTQEYIYIAFNKPVGIVCTTNRKVEPENIIDYILLKLLSYDENYLGNLNGSFKLKFDELNNKLLKSGEIFIDVKEKKINLKHARFNLGKIGILKTKIKSIENEDKIIFLSNNTLDITNHIEFAKTFQIGSNKVRNINRIYFDLKKNIRDNQITISNVRINSSDNNVDADNFFIIKNIQNLRASIRKIID